MKNEEKVILIVMSRILDYPDRSFWEERSLVEQFVEEHLSSAAIREEVLKGITPLYEMTKIELQEQYVATFDNKEMANLYLTAHELGDSKKRGAALIQLQKLIVESGFEWKGKELADYIPMLLELLAFAPESENMNRLSSRLAFCFHRIQKALPDNHPYVAAISLLTKYVFATPGADEMTLLENEREETDHDELPYPLMYR